MTAQPNRVGSCWYRSENQGRMSTQIAAQRWIAELIEAGRITRGQRLILEEMAKHIDARRTTQKSIAFLAKRCGVRERTVQRYLRGLCPSKARDPEAWTRRILTRRFIHAAPEPGRKADNVPSWFTLEIPEAFFTRKGPASVRRAPEPTRARPPKPRPASAPRALGDLSPGGVEIVTQAVILGSGSTEITDNLHPCTNLAREPGDADAPSSPTIPTKAAPLPRPPPSGGVSLAVTLCAQLFPSHAPIAHKQVAKLAALGWTEDQIATYLRRAARDPALGSARHPLITAVWLAERDFRHPPKPQPLQPPAQRPETPRPAVDDEARAAIARPVDPLLQSKIERARRALRDAEAKTGTKRRQTPDDLPKGPGGGPGDGSDPKGGGS